MAKARKKGGSASKAKSAAVPRKAATRPQSAFGSLSHAGPARSLGVQPKLDVSRAGDAHEQEADRAADAAVAGRHAPSLSPVQPGALARVQRQENEKKPSDSGDKEPEKNDTEDKKEEDSGGKEGGAAAEKPAVQKKAQAGAGEEVEGKEKEKEDKQAEAAEKQEKADDEEKKSLEAEAEAADKEKEEKQEAAEEKQEEKSEKEAVGPEKAVQKKAAGQGRAASDSSEAERTIRNPGPGQPLRPDTRRTLESSLGKDLGGVRVHEDGRARAAASALQARAFAHGKDIFLGPGASQGDKHLMAHEAAHTVQQAGGQMGPSPGGHVPAGVSRVQRDNGTPGGGGAGGTAGAGGTGGTAGTAGTGGSEGPGGGTAPGSSGATFEGPNIIVIPELKLPAFRNKGNIGGGGGSDLPAATAGYDLPEATQRGNQRETWRREMTAAGSFQQSIKDFVATGQGIPAEGESKPIYYLRKPTANTYFIGNEDALPALLPLPNWQRSGGEHAFDVDHMVELQLGGADNMSNYEMLDASANRSSGSNIKNELKGKIEGAAADLAAAGTIPATTDTSVGAVRNNFAIRFTRISKTLSVAGNPEIFWSRQHIEDGEHLRNLRVMTAAEVEAAGLRGSPTNLSIFPTLGGSSPRRVTWGPDDSGTEKPVARNNFFRNFDLQAIQFAPGQGGHVRGVKWGNNRAVAPKPVQWALHPMPGSAYAGAVDRAGLLATIRALVAKQMSPIEIQDAYLDEEGGEKARGVIRPSIPLLRGLELDLELDGGEVTVSKTLQKNDFNFPGPFRITDTSLTIGLSTQRGAFAEGEINFEIQGVGRGRLRGEIRSGGGGGLDLSGNFNFDSNAFTRAEVEVWYRNNEWGARGTLGIGEGKLKGVRSAEGTVSYANEEVSAELTAQLSLRAFQQSTLRFRSSSSATEFGGDFLLRDGSGIKNGRISVTVRKEGEAWNVSGTGSAESDVPGITAGLDISFENEIFTAEATVGYRRGMLDGRLMVGVTNRPVGEGGRPEGGEGGDTLILYGGGSVTLKIAPWLAATAEVRIKPNGEKEVIGRIGLPDTLEVFPEKSWERELFNVGMDIPILGVAVAGQRVGIFATIRGGAAIKAGIGPGQLTQLSLEVQYNPEREQETSVTGRGTFQIPMSAGLRVFAQAAIGAGIPIVSATMGLEVGAEMGIRGRAYANAEVNWTPVQGLRLEAEAGLEAEPVLRADISGFIDVSADLLISTIELYHQRWQFAAVEMGSGAKLGAKLPIRWQEGQPFEPSLDDVEITKPDIDFGDFMDKIKEKIL